MRHIGVAFDAILARPDALRRAVAAFGALRRSPVNLVQHRIINVGAERLPGILSQLGEIDLFVHDSLHTERNVRFEMDRAWASLRPGGAIVVDDIDANRGFRSFTRSFSGNQSIICEAEPLHPDFRRFNKKGLFGIVLKEPTERTES